MSHGAYAAAYEQSISDPTTFWGNAAKAIEWITEPPTVLDDSNPRSLAFLDEVRSRHRAAAAPTHA